MTKQSAIEEKKQLQSKIEELDKIINAPDITPEKRFWQLMNGCTIYTEDESPDSVFWIKDGKVWFELKNQYLLCRYDSVWSVLEKEYSLNYYQVQQLIKVQMEKRFGMRDLTPLFLKPKSSIAMEKRFGMRDLTPEKENY